MRKQQQIWQEEHQKATMIPGLADNKPSNSVIFFIEYLKKHKLFNPPLTVIDIGSGKGRNSIYLAENGCEVYAIDYVKDALAITKKRARERGVSDKVKVVPGEIDKKWPFADNFFDLAIDCYSSIDIETRQGRKVYKSELHRTLKPGGFALVAVVAADDPLEKEIAMSSPGPEPNSVIWPETGKFQKNYSKEELKKFYNSFKIMTLKTEHKLAKKLGRQYRAKNYWLILQKP